MSWADQEAETLEYPTLEPMIATSSQCSPAVDSSVINAVPEAIDNPLPEAPPMSPASATALPQALNPLESTGSAAPVAEAPEFPPGSPGPADPVAEALDALIPLAPEALPQPVAPVVDAFLPSDPETPQDDASNSDGTNTDMEFQAEDMVFQPAEDSDEDMVFQASDDSDDGSDPGHGHLINAVAGHDSADHEDSNDDVGSVGDNTSEDEAESESASEDDDSDFDGSNVSTTNVAQRANPPRNAPRHRLTTNKLGGEPFGNFLAQTAMAIKSDKRRKTRKRKRHRSGHFRTRRNPGPTPYTQYTETSFTLSADTVMAALALFPSPSPAPGFQADEPDSEPQPISVPCTASPLDQRNWRGILAAFVPKAGSKRLPQMEVHDADSLLQGVKLPSPEGGQSLLKTLSNDIAQTTGYIYVDRNDPPPVPRNFNHVLSMKDHHRATWLNAIGEEMANLRDSCAFQQVTKAQVNGKALDVRFVFVIKKPDELGRARAKCRMVVRGDQQPLSDSPRWEAPTVRYTVLKMAAMTALTSGNQIGKFDIKAAFLTATMDGDEHHDAEVIYIRVKNTDGTYSYYRLLKSVYGLRSAPGRFYALLRQALVDFGLTPCERDPCTFSNGRRGNANITVCIYVDDGLIFSSESNRERLMQHLKHKFDDVSGNVMDHTPSPFLGAMWSVNYAARTITINQTDYIQSIIAAQPNTLHPAATPAPQQPLRPHDTEESSLDYLVLVGMIGWVAQVSRPDILYAYKECARHAVANGPVHMKYAQRILRYLSATIDASLTLRAPACMSQLRLMGWSDASYAECPWTRRSTTGVCVTLAGSTIHGRSITQNNVAQSSCEAEVYAAFEVAATLVHYRAILAHIGYHSHIPSTIHVDSKSAQDIVKRLSLKKNSKHFDVKFFRLREYINDRAVTLKWEPTSTLVADALTKALPSTAHQRHAPRLLQGRVFSTQNNELCDSAFAEACHDEAILGETVGSVSHSSHQDLTIIRAK